MTKIKTTKRALLLSVISMMLCLSMLVGSTFAWFTDTVYGGQIYLRGGRLKIAVEQSTDLTNWKPNNNKDNDFFHTDDVTTLRKPGHTAYTLLRVKNDGNLSLQYQCQIKIRENKKYDATSVEGNKIDLTKYIKVAAFDLLQPDVEEALTPIIKGTVADPEAALLDILEKNPSSSITLSDKPYFEGTLKGDAAGTGTGFPAGTGKVSAPIMLVVYMSTTVGNEANHNGKGEASIKIDVNIEARQYTYENDSFGNQFDKNATYKNDLSDGNNNKIIFFGINT